MIYEFLERTMTRFGVRLLPAGRFGDTFDMPRAAWTYRSLSDTDPHPAGYAPLGVEGGIRKAQAKMEQLRNELASRGISLGVVVYPWPAQLAHDHAQSLQVKIWKEWCEDKCSRFVSMFPDFLAVKQRCSVILPGCWYEDLFVFGDVHYNEAGNAIIARRVVESLRATQ
jgi:hypothetical protein